MRLHVERDAGSVITGIPCRLAKNGISKRHQHPAMNDTAHVDVTLVDDEGKMPSALWTLFKDRPDMKLERIDEMGERVALG